MTANGQEINQGNAGSKYKDKSYVRVTSVIRGLAKGFQLDKWMIDNHATYKDYLEDMRQSAERGSRVDSACKKLLQGLDLTADETSGIEPYLEAFRRFRASWGIVGASFDEEVVDEELKVVGTLDIFGTLKNGEEYPEAVVDIKTGHPTREKDGSKKYGVYDEMHWQTAAYRSMKNGKSNWILRLFDDGEFRLVADPDYEKSIKIFTLAAQIAHLRK